MQRRLFCGCEEDDDVNWWEPHVCGDILDCILLLLFF